MHSAAISTAGKSVLVIDISIRTLSVLGRHDDDTVSHIKASGHGRDGLHSVARTPKKSQALRPIVRIIMMRLLFMLCLRRK